MKTIIIIFFILLVAAATLYFTHAAAYIGGQNAVMKEQIEKLRGGE